MPIPGQNLLSKFIPGPVGGWNTRDPLWAMPEADARVLDNIFPDVGECRTRGGVELFYTDGVSSNEIRTLASHTDRFGNEYLVCTNSLGVFNISAGTRVDITPVGWVADIGNFYQHVSFNGVLVFSASFNSLNPPFYWDTAASPAVFAAITGPSSLLNLNNVSTYRSRLYYVESASSRVWYGAVGALSGAFSSFDFSSVWTKGGRLVACGSTNKSTGEATDQYFVAVSSKGEVLVYQGEFPSDSTWGLIGIYSISPPMHQRCMFKIGGDLHIITQRGPVSLSALISGGDVNNSYNVVAGKIEPSFVSIAPSSEVFVTWAGLWCPLKRYVIISIPTLPNTPPNGPHGAVQYVMNTITGAWCRFTGITATSWALFGGGLPYFATGNKVYKFDVMGSASLATLDWQVRSAYNSIGSIDKLKKFNLMQPIFSAAAFGSGGGPGSYTLGMDVDFVDDFATYAKTLTFGDDVFLLNKDLQTVTGSGQWAAYSISGSFGNAQLKFFGNNIFYEQAGIGA